jgi:IPT/TIG domain/Regulator of chromosome condensation (RCC1) repeat
VMAWGENEWGQLGNGTSRNHSDLPVAVSGLTDVTAVAAGTGHSLALLSNGTVVAWGSNQYGELGDGTEVESDVPVAVGGLSGVADIAAGGTHSLALLDDGRVMAWGSNVFGELGDGTFSGPQTCSEGAFQGSCSDVPVAVRSLRGVTAIAAGLGHSLALLGDGTVMAWGSNDSGELGDETVAGPETCIFGPNSSACSDVPVAVSRLSEVTAVAAGDFFSLGLGLRLPSQPAPTITQLQPKRGSAAGGTKVTITGTGFTGATAVKFGSVDATSFTVNSSKSITARSPAERPGTVEVTVTTANGTVTSPGHASAGSKRDHFTFKRRKR